MGLLQMECCWGRESGEIRLSLAGAWGWTVGRSGKCPGAGGGMGAMSPVMGLEWRCRDGQAGPGASGDNEERELRDLTSAEVLVLHAVVSKEKGCLSS